MPRLNLRLGRRWNGAWLFGICWACSPAFAQWQARVSNDLLSVYTQAATGSASASSSFAPLTNGSTAATRSLSPLARFDSRGRVQIDVHFNCAVAAPTQALASAGLSIGATVQVPPLCVVQGWIAPSAVPTIASLANVVRVELPKYALHRTPRGVQPGVKSQQRSAPLTQGGGANTIDGNAVSIMHVAQYISSSGVNGKGVTIGVMSDNVSSLSVIQGRSELPAVTVVPSSPGGSLSTLSGDEGTMMLEEVYAVAPGASLAFCAGDSSTEYVGCLSQLIAAGATILVDDLAFPGEDLLSSNGEMVAAVQSVLSQNSSVLLFTVTENYNGSYWQGQYAPVAASATGYPYWQCTDSTTNTTQTDYFVQNFGTMGAAQLSTLLSGTYPAMFQWGDPFNANVSNFDLYVIDSGGNSFCVMTAGQTPTQYFGNITLNQSDTYQVMVGTPDTTLTGKFLKLWVGGDGATTLAPSTAGSEISPQTFLTNVVKIGAMDASDGIGDTLEAYSGLGPINLLFPAALSLQAPLVVSLDGNYVDASGTTFTTDNGLFFGTSAAAPNAAAVAALIKSAFPNLTPVQLTSTLETGATSTDGSVPDDNVGYGRIDAVGALGTLPAPTISSIAGATFTTGTSSTPVAFTLTGTGNLTLSVQSSNTTLVPAALVASGTAGVTIMPTTCGTSTLSCTLSVTPVSGQVGTVTITLIATDGAKREGTAAAVETVQAPPSHGGGTIDWSTLLLLAGTLALRVRHPKRAIATASHRA